MEPDDRVVVRSTFVDMPEEACPLHWKVFSCLKPHDPIPLLFLIHLLFAG
jgi:hypothetical protein